jgi:TonB family protein
MAWGFSVGTTDLDYNGKGKYMQSKHWMAALLCAAISTAALASGSGPGAVRKTAEASMLVTGWIEVMPDGSVHDYSINHSEKIPPVVLNLIKQNVPTWTFKLDGQANVIERARMNIRIVARQVDEQHSSITITDAFFGDGSDVGSDYVSRKNMVVPKYPQEAVQSRVEGTVYVLIRVNRQGLVQDAIAEQVNLDEYGDSSEMSYFRNVLAGSAVSAIKRWTFNLPTTGTHMADDYWDVRIPVNFSLNVAGRPKPDTYGTWQGYIPGPRMQAPWRQQSATSGSDAIPAGSLSQADEHLHLTTSLGGA